MGRRSFALHCRDRVVLKSDFGRQSEDEKALRWDGQLGSRRRKGLDGGNDGEETSYLGGVVQCTITTSVPQLCRFRSSLKQMLDVSKVAVHEVGGRP